MTTVRADAAGAGKAAAIAGPRSAAFALFAAYSLMLCTLLWPALREMAGVWAGSSTFHHGFLVAPVALWMAASTPAPAAPRPSILGLPFLAFAGLVWLVGEAAGVALIAETGFVSLLVAGVIVFFGPGCAKVWALPLAFLYFMVPFGQSFLPALQVFAAEIVAALLNASAIATAREGVLLTTSAGAFEIAEACAGLNFLLAAVMVAVFYSWMTFRSLKKIAAFATFAIGLAVIANVFRAYVVIAAATLTDGKYAIGDDHIIFGWIFYGALLFVLIAIGQRFADTKKPPPPAMSAALPQDPAPLGIAAMAGAFLLVMIVAGYDRLVIEAAPPQPLPTSLPLLNAPGWRVDAPPEGWRASLDGADRRLYATYRSGAKQVFLAAGYFGHDRQGAEIAGYSTRPYSDVRWRKVKTLYVPLDAFGKRGTFSIDRLAGADGRRLDALIVYWLGDRIYDNAAGLKAAQAKARLLGRNPRGGVFFLAAPAAESATDARSFLESVEPLGAWLARIDNKLSN